MKHLKRCDGQTLLISVFLTLLVFLMVPAIVLFNQVNTAHQSDAERHEKGRAIAQEGISYAAHLLSKDQTTWNQAMATPPIWPTGCNGANPITGADGGHFKLTCDKVGAQSYQVHVVATAFLPGKSSVEIPSRALSAYFSQRTMALSLSNGYQTSTAVQLGLPPIVPAGGTFLVYWGPIVVLNDVLPPTPWTIPNFGTPNMDTNQFPRKFSSGGIIGGGAGGTTLAPTTNTDPGASLLRCGDNTLCTALTDQKEYWAFNDLGSPLLINVAGYAVGNANTIAGPPPATDATPTHNYYATTATTLTTLALDLKTNSTVTPPASGAVIIDANLVITDAGGDGFAPDPGASKGLRVPPTAAFDFPYTFPPPPNGFSACIGNSTCTAALTTGGANIQFRGFLHVTGTMTVNAPSVVRISGALRVDGQLTVQTGATLIVYYDDQIGHNILVPKLELQTDSVRDIPVL